MMTPWSRYRYCVEYTDTSGNRYLDEREPFRYRDEYDNKYHVVVAGETYWGLAHRYFQGITRPAGLWWLIPEYQPAPVVDPTIVLSPGTMLVIPSLRVIRLFVFSEDRRKYH